MARNFRDLLRTNPEARFDPFIRQEVRREERRDEMNSMHPMNQMPRHSGWIWLLQNRVNLRSVGNMHFATKVWFDNSTKSVGQTQDYDQESFVSFRLARLSNGQKADGWIEQELGNRFFKV